MSARRQALVDLVGVTIFLLPLCGFLALIAYDFAAASWSIHESSREPGGLPYPMIPLLKSLVIVMPVAVALQGVSMLMRAVTTLRGK
jgi:TRAP-type mannitol/chloroaromatic compound transport system permease small subunit